ncbi:solute carrier family 46 member 3-like [Portunus trituberculatus]|uniref:solute carrier family 46 member 3-like n=1 Tax=Portunus trituberculatus TaxID=210409 RepID=UPI001E1CD5FB|nr:solute carrier family 46 member 3-like [Portunus trituberculatus]
MEEALKEYTLLKKDKKEERVGERAEGGGEGGKGKSTKVAQVAVVVGESRGARPEEGSTAPLHIPSPTQDTNDTTPGPSCCSAPARMHATLLKVLRGVSLEPMLFLKMMAEGNFGVVADTLEQERVCRINLNFSQEECAGWIHDANLSYVKEAVQHRQNLFNYNQSIMDSVLPLAVVLFAGSLSDRHGRKPPMLAVLAGFVALAAAYLAEALNPEWPVQVLYAGTLAVDLMGSWVVFNMAVYSYVADISTPETRTRRLAILDAVWYLGGPLGRLLGGWLYHLAGYAVVFAVSGALWLVCFLYTLLLVRETVDRATHKPEMELDLGDARWGPLRHVVALCRTTFKARPRHGRLYLLVIVALKMAVFLVQGHLMYQWAQNVLRWGAAEYSTWSSVDSVVHQVGMVAWTWVAARLALHDTLVAAGGVVSIALWSAILASITQPQLWWIAVVATVAGMLEPCMEPALRTLLTTEVGEGEAGRVLALMGLVEAAWFLADRSIYTFLYNAFFTVFPQINLVVQAGLCVPLLLALLLLWRALRNRTASSYDLPHQE